MRWSIALLLAASTLAAGGCTVSIPDAAHFPEVYDAHASDVGKDAGDATKTDTTKTDTLAGDAPKNDVAGNDVTQSDLTQSDLTQGDAPQTDAAAVDIADVQSVDVEADDVDVVDAGGTDQDAAADELGAPGDSQDDVPTDAGPACTPTACDDGNPCTIDGCETGQCAHSAAGAIACPDDGLACTLDLCAGFACGHTDVVPGWCLIAGSCVAAGVATADGCATCDPPAAVTAWTALPDTATCSDGSVCTVGDHCTQGACTGGAAIACDDGNPCTADTCDPATGCGNAPLPDGSACPVSGACVLPGACLAGSCSTSAKLWTSAIDGGFGGADDLRAVAIAPGGDILAAGRRTSATGSAEAWGVHLNAAASIIEFLPGLSAGGAEARYDTIAAAADGSVALGGTQGGTAVVSLRLATGAVVQVKPFQPVGGSHVRRLLAVAGGWLALDGAADIARLQPAGGTQWLAAAAELPAHGLAALAAAADGGALAVGTQLSPADTDAAGVVVRVSATGATLWTRRLGTAATQLRQVAALTDGSWSVLALHAGILHLLRLSPLGELLADASWQPPADWSLGDATLGADQVWRVTGTVSGHVWLGAIDVHGGLRWQRSYEEGNGLGVALLPSGAAVLAGSAATPSDGLVIRADAWGDASCDSSQLCSNLSWNGCEDSLACTVDICSASACTHVALAGGCDDGDVCTAVDVCAGAACKGTAVLGESTLAGAPLLDAVATFADGGALVADSGNTLHRLDARGQTEWTTAVPGALVSGLAAWSNGWSAALAGGQVLRYDHTGTLVGLPLDVPGAVALAAQRDGSLAVAATVNAGLPGQLASVQRFAADWSATSQQFPGKLGVSKPLAIAAASDTGWGLLASDGGVVQLHRLDADLNESWVVGLSATGYTALAAMPDGGWLAAGLAAGGIALERRGPGGSVEFASVWPLAGLTAVSGAAVLPDGSSAVAISRTNASATQGGLARFGPLGGLLSLSWGPDASQVLGVAASRRPDGVWAVGGRPDGGWLHHLDRHGGDSCALAGACVSQSWLCDDGNPCTRDGCAAGACTAAPVSELLACPGGGICSADHVCPTTASCGDGKCAGTETSASCPADCSNACDSLVCDDGDPCTLDYCQGSSCQVGGVPDGLACAAGLVCLLSQCVAPVCGDGTCMPGETATSCPGDCPGCGDAVCAPGENNHTCPADCAKPASGCQNMCGWKSNRADGSVCWCDATCTPGPQGDCCDDKATFCP